MKLTYQVEDLGNQLSDRLLATTGALSWIAPAGVAALIAGLLLIFLLIGRFRPGASSIFLT
jgi:hypothetical protein